MEINIGDFAKHDWQNIPLNLRYLIYFGSFLIFMAWLYDHWGSSPPPALLDYRESAFNFGSFLILWTCIFIGSRQIRLLWLRLQATGRWKKKYPLCKLNKAYYLVAHDDWLYLYDLQEKQKYHLKNPETVRDLEFGGEWAVSNWEEKEIVVKNGSKIKPEEFKEVPGGINTLG